MSKTLPSYTSSTADKPLLGMTIGDMLDRTAERFPNNDALVCLHQDIRWTYKEFVETVNEAARAFMAIGVKRGDRVGIWSPNRYEWTVTQFATAKVGAILVNINPAYGVHELQYALNLAGITTLVTADSFKASNYREMIYELAPELKRSSPGKLKADHVPELRAVINVHEDKHDGMWTWAEFVGFASDVSQEELDKVQGQLQFDDPINIQFTSGTTGAPKGATLTHYNIVNNARFVTGRIHLAEGDRLCIPVPLYHCFGMVMGVLGSVAQGATMVFPGEGFDAAETLDAIEAERCVGAYGVPTMFVAMLDEQAKSPRDLSSLRTGVMAGAPCPVDVMKQVNNKMNMNEVTICYGMTETGMNTSNPYDGERRAGTVGFALPGTEVRVMTAEGIECAPGEIGELQVCGQNVFSGYWRMPEKTAEEFAEGGWFKTGDVSMIDADGYVHLVGRAKDLIISGGFNVYPKEIEGLIDDMPEVLESAIVGVPHRDFGEAGVAVVVLNRQASLDEATLIGRLKEAIANYKVPKHVAFVESLPRNTMGKVQKNLLRETYRDACR